MHYLVADIARTITLYPGDVLLSGTPANSRPVQPGDIVEHGEEAEEEALESSPDRPTQGDPSGSLGIGSLIGRTP